ncbi:hypothetical protein GIB67_028950 [Kingdonia uniflora]|uniref:Subtilisin-like protease fibronectin type-III domain-containing protein n=1 Tax=Kingdonia uniflora TaxID=39325 RepID=A0A7J7LC97_9MAGN|nr:hypothetical protein GIB67_028950 [Kingdonia uniflora]
MNFTREQFLTIARSSNYNCSNPSSDLNYPSFIALFSDKSANFREFKRTVTNVGNGASTYTANLLQPNGTRISVSPKKVGLSREVREAELYSTYKDREQRNGDQVYGSLVWVDREGKHTVRSPIIVMNMLEE